MRVVLLGACLTFAIGCGGGETTPPVQENKFAPPPLPSFKSPQPSPPPQATTPVAPKTLAEARKSFQTKLLRAERANEPVDQPPPGVFNLIQYDSPAGLMAAYVSPAPKGGLKKPIVIWITGGDCNTIGDVWSPPQQPANDQSGRVFREAGLLMMFPSTRGGNQNPGVKEGFYGEIDDILAAVEYAAKLPYVDANRIYLGGHSTGGTTAMLCAEMSGKFRAVFAFGPADTAAGHGGEFNPYNLRDQKEVQLRAPILWLGGIQSPTFVFEGATNGNVDSLLNMQKASKNPKVQFFPMRGFDHFSVLAPTSALIAKKIVADTGEQCNIAFTEEELRQVKAGPPPKKMKR